MSATKRKRTNTWIFFQNTLESSSRMMRKFDMQEPREKMPNLWQELNLFPNKSSNTKVLCLGVSPKHLNFSHSCCGAEQFLYERNLRADQCFSNPSEEIQFWAWWGHHSYLSRRKCLGSLQPKMTWEQGIGWFGFRLCSSVFLVVSVCRRKAIRRLSCKKLQ